jgi:hypothetical protein
MEVQLLTASSAAEFPGQSNHSESLKKIVYTTPVLTNIYGLHGLVFRRSGVRRLLLQCHCIVNFIFVTSFLLLPNSISVVSISRVRLWTGRSSAGRKPTSICRARLRSRNFRIRRWRWLRRGLLLLVLYPSHSIGYSSV